MNEVQLFTEKETQKILHLTEKKLRLIRQEGLIGWHRVSKGYTYSDADIKAFVLLTQGVDLSTNERIKAFANEKRIQPASKGVR